MEPDDGADGNVCPILLNEANHSMPRVTVRYHALLREKTGLNSEAFEISLASACVSDVLAAFVKRHAAFERLAPALHVAIQDEIVSREQAVRDDETLDLMPPFG